MRYAASDGLSHVVPRAAAAFRRAWTNHVTPVLSAVLLQSRLAAKAKTQGSVGLHASVHTPSFASAFPRPEQQLRTASIFVQRWSVALATTLHQALAVQQMHAWAEIATPSLARRANLTIGALYPRHRGALFHACCTRHVKLTSRNFLPDERRFALRLNHSVVRLYHPVKF